MYLRQKKGRFVIEHKLRLYITLIILAISTLFISFIYYFDRVIAPTVLLVADAEMRAKSMEIVNKNIGDIYGEGFVYEEIMDIDKDDLGKITMVKADTMKLNSLATKVAITAQKDIEEVGSVGVKVPIGYALKNNILAYFGPKITVRMEPIGRIKTSYESTFESAGINQTRHKIYINMETNLKIVLPLQSREVIVRHQIPIAENIIIGEVPRTSIGIDAIKEAMTNDYDGNGIETESIEGQNLFEKADEIALPDIPDLGVEFKN